MLSRAAAPRRGTTLIELLVTLVIAGVALGLISAISVRQQRVVADLTSATSVESQIGDALAVLSVGLAGVSSGAGDIREARDTSLEIRATIASAVSCDSAAGRLILSPASAGGATYGTMQTAIEVGDTAWVLTPFAVGETWRPYRVGGTSSAPPGDCASTGPRLDAAARQAARVSVELDAIGPIDRLGIPIRFTRPARYSLYRASDGQWYLGFRDWDNGAARFNTIQPVSGPFLPPSALGLAFQFADTAGRTLAVPVADTRTIALVRIDVRATTRAPVRALSARAARRQDAAGEWILLRNRR